ncbi:hypothetical protein [Flavobacterium degerlachei]|jgi:uncharacterized protein YdeI (YjbR/CyaY-like superfamily)|uniref:Uncharacterized protein n=1 Tax=Flavobacterium degerlachei TaxID=229203 RepID=A0A1H2WNX8_9FLAO|nr:hypothetical protein [Flavobacterium degerlachei]SDW81974.1 hypothetical protein SAMN05444338_1059 [Flavobacterium degerlachei]
MKNYAIKLVWLTTLYVFIFAALCLLNIPIQVLTIFLFIGYFLILFMVYKVLTDKYSTTKTFKDWYEDQPMDTLDE